MSPDSFVTYVPDRSRLHARARPECFAVRIPEWDERLHRLLSKLLQLLLLCAFPDNRRGTAARRGRGRVPQLGTADGARPVLFSPTPFWNRDGRRLDGKGLERSVAG